jgi:uncharacterized SAM-binding protein YcdF (DUF218 family)
MTMSRSLRRRWIGFAVVVLLAGALVWCVRRVGVWLVVEDQLEPATAIVVLSGRMPMRAREAAKLYREGWSARVWVTKPAGPVKELEPLGISYVGEEFYNVRVLMALGVPSNAIFVLAPSIVNTADEVDAVASELQREGGNKVILVTTKPHTRRVRTIWRRRFGNSPRAIVRYATDDRFDPAHWWRTTGGALDVVREVLGLANTWAGFPLRPDS